MAPGLFHSPRADAPRPIRVRPVDPRAFGAETSVLGVELANRVGRRFAKTHPGIRFNTLNYGERFPGNEKVRFEPNVGAAVADLRRVNLISPAYFRKSVAW